MKVSRNDNRGFSLVELMVVVAIMAVMGSFMFIGNALVAAQYPRECANDLSAALNKEKNYALTKSATIDCYMELIYDSDGYYVRYYQPRNAVVKGDNPSYDWVLAEEEKVGKSAVDIICEFDGVSSVSIGSGTSVKFIYNRISGEFKKSIISDGSTPGIGSEDAVSAAFCKRIEIKGGRTYEITIYSATGKHELTRVN